MNDIFDILSTNTKYSMWPFKNAMSSENKIMWKPVLDKTYNYVFTLRTFDNISLSLLC